ncbi:MAG: hypothetical protein ACJA0V_002324 [Planctomycetota bacterium]|jgi:hypothetical protein
MIRTMTRRCLPWLLLAASVPAQEKLAQAQVEKARAVQAKAVHSTLTVYPTRVTLDSGLDTHRLVAQSTTAQGLTTDVSGALNVQFQPAGIATFREGRLVPLQNGETIATVRHDNLSATVKVTVQNATFEPPVSYRMDVIPILTRAGCNSGACHGAASGKNGFGLTLFGFDPKRDLRALSRDFRSRRIDCADPDTSLILTKPSGKVSHKGGKRIEPDSDMWHMIRSWIAAGASDDGDNDDGASDDKKAPIPELVRLAVEPRDLVLAGPDQRAALVVTAEYSDGSLRDVTDLALMSSSNTSSATIEDGTVKSASRGEAFVLARFGFLAQVANVIVLPNAEPWQPPAMQANNEIDILVQQKLTKLRLAPAPQCDDQTFLRRVFVDVIGQLPTPAEVRTFLADSSDDKRARIVDELLKRPEFPDVWAMAWAEVLRIESDQLEVKGVHVFTRWLREALRDGVPMDEIVRRMLTATGGAYAVPEANYWVTATSPKVLAENAAQTFLGIRLQCAQCHNHPFERWRMDDYYGFAAFFGRVGRKNGDDPRDTVIFDRGSGEVTNERTQTTAKPQFLGGALPTIKPGVDRRAVMAEWLTSRKNPWFAKNIANRVWARFFGRGLVQPVDDVRVSNPPSHPDLHRRLGERLAAADFDIRELIREICASATYQSTQHPNAPPASTYAGMPPRRMSAEQMLDAIGSITEVRTKFSGIPLGQSAVQIVDANGGSRFLDLFGRPDRESVCTCDRREEPTLNQVLHLINGETIERKLRSSKSRVARLLAAKTAPDQILSELFLATYARLPRKAERERILLSIRQASAKPRDAWDDVLWSMFNSKEFLFQH